MRQRARGANERAHACESGKQQEDSADPGSKRQQHECGDEGDHAQPEQKPGGGTPKSRRSTCAYDTSGG
jgi:hypothetical protein